MPISFQDKAPGSSPGNVPSDIDHLPMIRQFLKSLDVEWVIENVPEAWSKEEKENITFSCGSHFGLGVQRHRYFQAGFPIEQLKCDHNSPHCANGPKGKPKPIRVYGRKGDKIKGMCHKTGKDANGRLDCENSRRSTASNGNHPHLHLEKLVSSRSTCIHGAHLKVLL